MYLSVLGHSIILKLFEQADCMTTPSNRVALTLPQATLAPTRTGKRDALRWLLNEPAANNLALLYLQEKNSHYTDRDSARHKKI